MQEKENAHAGDMGAKNSNGSSKDVPKSKSSINREDLQQQKLNAALYYARRGWPVFPLHYPTKNGCSCKNPQCSSIGKHPLTRNGFKDATTDEKVVRMWWRKWPDANVGIVTGKESGFIALDLDPRHEGDESIRKLEKRYGRMPETIESLTGGGGRHILFSHPGKRIKVMNSAGLGGKYPGLDIRGDGGYIVAPPSNHLSGNKYKWEPSHSPIDVELARIPDFILKLISDKKRRISTISEVGDIIPEGERNVILTSIAGSMRRRGLTEEEIYAALEKVNINRCRPPLPDEEVRHIAKSIMKYKPGRQPKKLGKSTPEKTAKIISKLPYELSVTDLWREIESILFGKFDDKKEYPMEIRRRDAGNLLLGWLQERGGFTQSTEGELFYFYEKHRRLFNIESEAWQAWLSMITNIIYVSTHFKYLDAYCKATALRTKKRRIYRCSYWDDNEKVLYVSRFDGTVYRLDGESITEGPNGKNVLFNDDVNWEPYKPEPGTKTNTLYWLTTELPNWDGNKEMYGLAFRAFIISTFFLELIPAKPILVMYGEKESGKSTCLRLMLRLLYGSFENVSGVPDKPDGFTAAASSAHILAIDNLDDIVPWMRDKLSRLSTGAIDECRKLFTSNEVLRIRYRCSLCITSRTPDTLRRDDLTDRLLILPVRIIKEGRKAERDLYQEVVERRNEFWYEMLNILSKVVRAIREGKLCSNYSIRMADWESLARLIAQEEGNEDLWDEFIPIYTTSQADFLLEGDPICDAIEQAMDNNWLNNKKFTSRELFETLTKALFGDDKIPKGWYKSPQSFSKRLASIRPVLAQVYGLRWEKGTTKATLNRYVYWFDEENKKDNNV